MPARSSSRGGLPRPGHPPRVPGKPALAQIRAGLGPLAAPSPGFAVASRASALHTAQRARTRSARPYRRRSCARRSHFGVSVPFVCSAGRHARGERLLAMPRADPLARLGATGPPARPRACAGKVKRKSYGALPRAHLSDLAAFPPSAASFAIAGAGPAPSLPPDRALRAGTQFRAVCRQLMPLTNLSEHDRPSPPAFRPTTCLPERQLWYSGLFFLRARPTGRHPPSRIPRL
jgi:hypothetical protein